MPLFPNSPPLSRLHLLHTKVTFCILLQPLPFTVYVRVISYKFLLVLGIPPGLLVLSSSQALLYQVSVLLFIHPSSIHHPPSMHAYIHTYSSTYTSPVLQKDVVYMQSVCSLYLEEAQEGETQEDFLEEMTSKWRAKSELQ